MFKWALARVLECIEIEKGNKNPVEKTYAGLTPVQKELAVLFMGKLNELRYLCRSKKRV